MKKIIVLLLVGTMLIGCGGMGKIANIKSEFLTNDDKKTCEQLGIEVASIEDDIADVKKRIRSKTGGNVAIFVISLVFLPALFAMDTSNTEKTELRSYQKRYEVLKQLCASKECGFEFKAEEVKEVKNAPIKVEKGATATIADSYAE